MSLRAGDLRDRIQIKRAVEADNGKGGYTTTWTIIMQPWAQVIGLNGREAVIAQALQGVSYYRLRIRWRSDPPRPADQIILRGVTLNIRSVADPTGRREELQILADTASTIAAA